MASTSYGVGQYVAAEGHVVLTGRGYPADATRRGVVSCHSNTTSGLSATREPSHQPHLYALADFGLPVISTDLGSIAGAFGNDTARTRVGQAWTYVKSPFGAKTDKMLLFGISGGSLAALNYARQNPTNVAAIALLLPLVNIQDAYDNRGFASQIETAYSNAWAANAATHDPAATGNQAALSGIPIKLWYSTDDAYAVASVVTAYATAVNNAGGSATTASMGAVGHTASALDSRDVLDFLGPYA